MMTNFQMKRRIPNEVFRSLFHHQESFMMSMLTCLLLATELTCASALSLRRTVLQSSLPRRMPPQSPAQSKRTTITQASLLEPLAVVLRRAVPTVARNSSPLAFAAPVLAFAAPGLIFSKPRIIVTLVAAIGLIGGNFIHRQFCKDAVDECPVSIPDWWESNAFTNLAVAMASAGAEAAAAAISVGAAAVSSTLSEDSLESSKGDPKVWLTSGDRADDI
jgi:hypothetical protein